MGTAVRRLRERGWLDDDERPTPSGTKARDAIEAATDRLAAPLVATLGARRVELVEAMRPLAERIMDRTNDMAASMTHSSGHSECRIMRSLNECEIAPLDAAKHAIANADGSQLKQITHEKYYSMDAPLFSRDGMEIVFGATHHINGKLSYDVFRTAVRGRSPGSIVSPRSGWGRGWIAAVSRPGRWRASNWASSNWGR